MKVHAGAVAHRSGESTSIARPAEPSTDAIRDPRLKGAPRITESEQRIQTRSTRTHVFDEIGYPRVRTIHGVTQPDLFNSGLLKHLECARGMKRCPRMLSRCSCRPSGRLDLHMCNNGFWFRLQSMGALNVQGILTLHEAAINSFSKNIRVFQRLRIR